MKNKMMGENEESRRDSVHLHGVREDNSIGIDVDRIVVQGGGPDEVVEVAGAAGAEHDRASGDVASPSTCCRSAR